MKTNSNSGGRMEVISGMLSLFLSEIPSVLLLRPPAPRRRHLGVDGARVPLSESIATPFDGGVPSPGHCGEQPLANFSQNVNVNVL